VKVVLVDFHDSFTHNIVHYLEAIGVDVTVINDDEINVNELVGFEAIILSPGPGLPKETKSLFSILSNYAESHMILGVCLGMQGIAQFFDAELYNLQKVSHGKIKTINVLNKTWLFSGCDDSINVGLYHSWAVRLKPDSVLKVTAQTDDHLVMAIEHESLKICAVQFHPESILTENGIDIFKNFLLKNHTI
jgi:anthranilate synthase component 2